MDQSVDTHTVNTGASRASELGQDTRKLYFECWWRWWWKMRRKNERKERKRREAEEVGERVAEEETEQNEVKGKEGIMVRWGFEKEKKTWRRIEWWRMGTISKGGHRNLTNLHVLVCSLELAPCSTQEKILVFDGCKRMWEMKECKKRKGKKKERKYIIIRMIITITTTPRNLMCYFSFLATVYPGRLNNCYHTLNTTRNPTSQRPSSLVYVCLSHGVPLI